MKPLPVAKTLPSVEPTLEDRDIWWWHVERRGREFSATKAIFCVYADADCRDAEVMLRAHIAPLCDCCHEQMSVMYFDGQLIDIRGTVVHLP